ncbi:MAG TPA: hypothetical protein VFT43_13770 [Candidatus Polarisedimenticolia bacterium]|nr:hypothetical protein [Candidatus Polarisedimenticolia bacterium]
MTSTSVVLFLSACTTAVIHALIPDHWLPFVVMSRSQGWNARRTATLTGLAGLLHVLMSILVGGAAIALGTDPARDLASLAGHSLEYLAGALLFLFGVAYGVWAHLREARAHGAVSHDSTGSGPASQEEHVHAHGHLLEPWFRRAVSGGALVVVIGISPCALLAPILFAAAAQGAVALAASAIGFAACTIGTMVCVTLFARRGMQRLDLPFFTRFGDLISGALIGTIGLLVMILEP